MSAVKFDGIQVKQTPPFSMGTGPNHLVTLFTEFYQVRQEQHKNVIPVHFRGDSKLCYEISRFGK